MKNFRNLAVLALIALVACQKKKAGGTSPAPQLSFEETFIRDCSTVGAEDEFSEKEVAPGIDASKTFSVAYKGEVAKHTGRGFVITWSNGHKTDLGKRDFGRMTIRDLEVDTMTWDHFVGHMITMGIGMKSKSFRMHFNVDDYNFRAIFDKPSQNFEIVVLHKQLQMNRDNWVESTESKQDFDCMISNVNRDLCKKAMEYKIGQLEVALKNPINKTVGENTLEKLSCTGSALKYLSEKILIPFDEVAAQKAKEAAEKAATPK